MTRIDAPRSDARFLAEVRERIRPLDLLLLGLAPAVLLAVHAQPLPAREALVFVREAPLITTAFTAHFVHLRLDHLLGNLVVYGLMAPTAYLLLVLSGRRSEFLMVTVTVLLAFPFVLTGLDSLVIDRGRLFGFSGLAMGFVGALPVALFLFLDERIEPAVGLDDAPLLFFVGIGVIGWRSLEGPIRVPVIAGAGLVAIVYAVRLVRTLPRPLSTALRATLGHAGYVELAAAAPVLFVLAVWTAFPADPTRYGTVVNLLGHFLGYTLGFLATFLAVRIDRAVGHGPDVPPPPPEPPIEGYEPEGDPPEGDEGADARTPGVRR